MTSLLNKKPEQVQYLRQQGFILVVLGRPLEATPLMERSLQKESTQVKLWRALIEAYQVSGRRKEAKEAYQRLRAIDANAAELAYRESILAYEDGSS